MLLCGGPSSSATGMSWAASTGIWAYTCLGPMTKRSPQNPAPSISPEKAAFFCFLPESLWALCKTS